MITVTADDRGILLHDHLNHSVRVGMIWVYTLPYHLRQVAADCEATHTYQVSTNMVLCLATRGMQLDLRLHARDDELAPYHETGRYISFVPEEVASIITQIHATVKDMDPDGSIHAMRKDLHDRHDYPGKLVLQAKTCVREWDTVYGRER